ncbi:MAG: hypothetical protein JOY71_28890 [Acetobacteraceae bacterium]|nr:hypothetical protein [Acetobacteraceae bacterium]
MQVTQNGSMRFHIRGRTGVDLMFGPNASPCEIVHRGQVHTINLKHPQVEGHRLWLDELAGESPARVGGRAYLPRSVVSLTPEHAALRTRNFALITIAPLGQSGIAAMLRFHPGCCVLTPEELRLSPAPSPTRGIAYASQAIRNAGCGKVAIDAAMPGAAELAEQLLHGDDYLEIVALMGERAPLGVSGATAVYRSVGPWLRLAARFPARLSAASVNEALIGLVSRCGVRAFTIPVQLPVLRADDDLDSGEIEVVVVAGTGTVTCTMLDPRIAWLKSNTAHMIMAVAHARQTGLRVGRLWLPAQDELGARIARGFAAAPELNSYEDLEAAFCNISRRRVALSVFPDDNQFPEAAAVGLTLGALPILGPGCAFARCAAFRGLLCVPYWDDAIAIATALTRTVERFDQLAEDYDRFRLEMEEMTQAGLAALLATSPEHSMSPGMANR